MVRQDNPFPEIERLFEQMQDNFERAARSWRTEGGEWPATMRVDVEDAGEEFVLTADLPGFDRDDIDVRMTDRTIHIEADHEAASEEETGEYVRRERHHESISRSLRLPEPIETEGIKAAYKNGVLTVRMPKMEPVEEGTEIKID